MRSAAFLASALLARDCKVLKNSTSDPPAPAVCLGIAHWWMPRLAALSPEKDTSASWSLLAFSCSATSLSVRSGFSLKKATSGLTDPPKALFTKLPTTLRISSPLDIRDAYR